MRIILKSLFIVILVLTATNTFAQVGIGTNSPAASAALEVTSATNNKGILIPRITASQKDAISNPAEGLMIYQTSAPTGFYYYTGTAWKLILTQTDLDAKLSTVDATISLNTKVDKVTGKELSSNDFTSAEKTKLAAITGSNSGDQDLSALATAASVALKANISDVNTNLALKANNTDLTNSLALKANTSDVDTDLATKVDKVIGKELSSNDFTSAEKTKLAAITGSNSGDQDLSALATAASVALKANSTDLNNGLASKVDKVSGKDLSSNDYTAAEKTKVSNLSGTNTGDQTTITGNAATATKLAAAKNINGVAFDGSTDITISATAAAEQLAGTTLKSTITGSSLTSVGSLANLTVTAPIAGSVTGSSGSTTGNAATATNLVGGSAGSIPYQTASATTALLAKGIDGQILTLSSGLPAWTTANSNLFSSVGVISNTSNANGLSITSGVLKLAPADAVNGGVVTTGTQTFAGDKAFDGSVSISRLQTNEVLDQSPPVTALAGTQAFTSAWQSFTAGLSGNLSKVSMQFYNSQASGTLSIHQGTGTGGTLLTSQPFTVSAVGELMVDFSLVNPVSVISGSVYTMVFITSTGTIWETLGENSPGRAAYYGNSPNSTSNTNKSFFFKTFVNQSSGGGTLTAGTVTYPNAHGTNGQVLTTAGSGALSWATPSTTATAYSGTLPITNGGTGASTLALNNVLLGNGTSALQAVAPGTAGNILTSNGTSWASTAAPNGLPTSGNSAGDMLYWNGTAWVKVAPGSDGQTLTFISGKPKWIGSLPANTVISTTGKIWMDRNLGATQVATNKSDASSFGDYYQWGRGADGHQLSSSPYSGTTFDTDNPENSNFVGGLDWRTTRNDNLWQGVNGINNPCPTGYRVPTAAEWIAESATWSLNSYDGAFASPLKLPAPGFRHRTGGGMNRVSTEGSFWSSTSAGGEFSNVLVTREPALRNIVLHSLQRAYGFSVRCIKD